MHTDTDVFYRNHMYDIPLFLVNVTKEYVKMYMNLTVLREVRSFVHGEKVM